MFNLITFNIKPRYLIIILMSLIPPSPNVITPPQTDFCLQLGLSHFERNITNNFTLINETMLRQADEISNLKDKYQQLVNNVLNGQFWTNQVTEHGSDKETASYNKQHLGRRISLSKQQFTSVQAKGQLSLIQQSNQAQVQKTKEKAAEASTNVTFMQVRKIPMQQKIQRQNQQNSSQQLQLAAHIQAGFKSHQIQVNSQNKIEQSQRDLMEVKTQPNLNKEKKSVLSSSRNVSRPNQSMLTEETANSIQPQSNITNKPSSNAAQQKQQQNSLENQLLLQNSQKYGQMASPKQNKQNSFQTPPSAIISNPMIEAKVFQLYQRVRLLEEKELSNSNQNFKHFRQIEYSLQGNNTFIQKNNNIEKKFEDEVQKLRNELSEYKLKKQAKLMKAINSNSMNQSGLSDDSMDYIAQKLQFLLKHIKQLLPRRSYEEDRVIKDQQIENLRTKVNKSVSEQLFNDRLKNLQLKIYQNIAQYMTTKMSQSTVQSQNGATVLEEFIAKGNNQFYQKVDAHSQKLDELQNEIDLLKANTEMNRRQRLLFQSNIGEEFTTEIERTNALEHRAQEIERSIQQSNKRLNQKHSEAEDQIAESQELIDQLTQRMKSITLFSRPPDSHQISSNTKTDGMNQPGQRSGIQFENDLQLQKKKLSKLISKVQSVKEDMLTIRETLMREIQGLKMNLEKKADWQSFKKTISYMDERMKQTKMMIQTVASSLPSHEGGQSLAVKKSWTCLMCDKQIKNYEGKLGEVKFTSMFPIKESPRIGGYFKQQKAAQEYKQVYLNNSPLGSMRRRPSLKPLNPKEEEER